MNYLHHPQPSDIIVKIQKQIKAWMCKRLKRRYVFSIRNFVPVSIVCFSLVAKSSLPCSGIGSSFVSEGSFQKTAVVQRCVSHFHITRNPNPSSSSCSCWREFLGYFKTCGIHWLPMARGAYSSQSRGFTQNPLHLMICRQVYRGNSEK